MLICSGGEEVANIFCDYNFGALMQLSVGLVIPPFYAARKIVW